MKGLPEAWSKESPPVMTTNVSRPNSLFQQQGSTDTGQDLKDLYLQDLSDGMFLIRPQQLRLTVRSHLLAASQSIDYLVFALLAHQMSNFLSL